MASKFREYGGTSYATKYNYINSQTLSLTKARISSIFADTIDTKNLSTPQINIMSDYRIKTNVSYNLQYSIDSIKPVSYYNKLTKRNECGVLAHELQEVYPNLVSGIKDDAIQFQTVNYVSLIAILIKEVQELKQDNTQLKKRMQSIQEVILETT
jgi:hypothetical protein